MNKPDNKTDLHVISFGVPYPANYGGAIDVWNRILALHHEGINIKLHCFNYGSFRPHDALHEVTKEVHYYPRITWPALLYPGQPYIVASRRNPLLLGRLKMDKAPILFEGIHTTGYVDELDGRKLLLRAHNVEHQYYSSLAKESQRFQYLFFQREALALERYENKKATSFHTVFTISKKDTEWFQHQGAKPVFSPAFHGFKSTSIQPGRGEYLLYQGDLSVESNQRSVFEVLKHLPATGLYPVIIAGRAGDRGFEQKLLKYPNLKRETDVPHDQMEKLVRGAQVVLIHSRHPSGMKVKLFPALYRGRFIVANENSLTHTAIDKAMHVYNNPQELNAILKNLWRREFTREEEVQRLSILSQLPSDVDKAKEIIKYI